MATYQAVAAVTAVLHDLISDEVARLDVGATAVKAEPPKDTRNDPQADQPAVHIFLYRVTENAVWRNDDLPLRGGNGQLVQRPRLALNLHYLITFYGDGAKYVPQKLLGAVAGLFQRNPVLTAAILENVQNAGDSQLTDLLQESRLAEDVERVKLSMVTPDVEEMSKLWSVLLQVPYALSLTYMADLVFIEPEESPSQPLPVLDRRIGTAPLAPATVAVKPQITGIAQEGDDLLLTIEPPLRPTQSAILLLTADWRQDDAPPGQHALDWAPPGGVTSISQPRWSIAGIPGGAYFVRVFVDGFISDLTISRDGALQGPRVTIGAAP